jgi:deoxyadenosine/deoxycytidine kinase
MIHIGISGPIASGKSTLAKSLKQLSLESGLACEIIPFATGVREVAALEEYNDIERRARITNLFYSWGYDYHLSLQAAALTDDYMQLYPSEAGKKNRRLLQSIGTEVGRQHVCEDIWIHRVQAECMKRFTNNEIGLLDFLISDDVRFDNEALAVDVHVRIDIDANPTLLFERTGNLDALYTYTQHASETSLSIPPLLTVPIGFTQQDVLSLLNQLERIRGLRG